MATINKIMRAFTREGARSKRFTPEMELRRALLNCLLWENQFYEDGVAIAQPLIVDLDGVVLSAGARFTQGPWTSQLAAQQALGVREVRRSDYLELLRAVLHDRS